MLLLLFFLFLAYRFFFLLYVSKLFFSCVLFNGRVRFLFLSGWSVHDCSTPCRVMAVLGVGCGWNTFAQMGMMAGGCFSTNKKRVD